MSTTTGTKAMGGTQSNQREKNKQPLTCLVVGAGSRGPGYAHYGTLYPDQLQVVGVAEPNEVRRNKLMSTHSINSQHSFSDWKEAAEQPKFADFVIVATCDRDHKEPAVAFAKLGYHILLEKPMAVTESDCREIVDVCNKSNVHLAVCHVLRYTPWVLKIKEVIDKGLLGEIVSIRHTEPVGFWHFTHSFVRGNWRNEATSTFSLMAKSCHDIDLINYWLSPHTCVQVSSFGKLTHFTKENKPEGASTRCMDCSVEQACPYSAKRLYLDFVKMGHKGWPVKVVSDIVDIENVSEALRKGPYGKCVYDTDNDVVSHQVVNMQYDNGATVAFNMVAFTQKICAREVHIYGTKGELTYEDGCGDVKVFDFLTQNTSYHKLDNDYPPSMGGHGGADYHLMKAFMDTLRGVGNNITDPAETLNSHLLVFAAEHARKENKVVFLKPDGSFEH